MNPYVDAAIFLSLHISIRQPINALISNIKYVSVENILVYFSVNVGAGSWAYEQIILIFRKEKKMHVFCHLQVELFFMCVGPLKQASCAKTPL